MRISPVYNLAHGRVRCGDHYVRRPWIAMSILWSRSTNFVGEPSVASHALLTTLGCGHSNRHHQGDSLWSEVRILSVGGRATSS